MVDWLGGPDFDGCLLFDECHKARLLLKFSVTPGCRVLLPSDGLGRYRPLPHPCRWLPRLLYMAAVCHAVLHCRINNFFPGNFAR